MDDELISLSVLIEHLSVERWLREHSSSFPKNLYEKLEGDEFRAFSFRDYIFSLLRNDLEMLSNRLALVADSWHNGKS